MSDSIDRHEDKLAEFLLVEDNASDAKLFSTLLSTTQIRFNLNIMRDGESASEYLFTKVKSCSVPRPDLIVLDLNLPKRDGREILHDCKQDLNLRSIPVMILSTSRDAEDIAQCYQRHANFYISKPSDLSHYKRVMASLEEFWFKIVQTPHFNCNES